VDDSEPPRYARYVQHLRRILLEDLALRDKAVLVLGAGGFTLSHREPSNRYTYVDIDSRSAGSPKRAFSRRPSAANSSWTTPAVTCAPPPSASTRWWWMCSAATPPSPATWSPASSGRTPAGRWPEGVLLANLILDGKLETPYARNLLATIESVFGRCGGGAAPGKPLSNVIVSCHASSRPAGVTPYSDERNGADVDLARSLRGLSGAIDSGQ
jgi:hypothetical protein